MRLWTYRVLKCHECDVITMGQGSLKYATSPWRPTLTLRDTALHCGWAVTSQARLLERHTSQKRMVGPGGPGQGRASSAIMEALSSLLGHQLPNTGPLRAPPQPEDVSLQPPGPATSLSVPTSTPPQTPWPRVQCGPTLAPVGHFLLPLSHLPLRMAPALEGVGPGRAVRTWEPGVWPLCGAGVPRPGVGTVWS